MNLSAPSSLPRRLRPAAVAPILSLLAALALHPAAASEPGGERHRPNVLLILVDDLKPTLGAYGDETAITPHLDALAARGMRFDLAYCNQAICAPSRYNLMLGSRSTSTGLYNLGVPLREVLPEAVTLPQHFAAHGYRTESLGKVYHIGHGNEGDPESFEAPHFHEKVIEYVDPANLAVGLTREEALFSNQRLDEVRSLPRGAAWESPDVDDDAYADGRVAAETVRRLEAAARRYAEEGAPFLIAAGFARPHLPFSAPKRYWDLYDPAALPMPEREDLPSGAPEVAGKRGGEIAAYEPVPEDPEERFSDELKRSLIHGYYASASYVDAQIGRILEALDELGLEDDTLVVLWGDHGFHLGDLGIWTKHTNYEQANRIPLVFAGPGVAAGAATRQLAETVDIFPTLAELAGLPAPDGPQPIDGLSLAPVLADPAARVRDHAYHAYPRGGGGKLGRAIRTARFRFVEWKVPGADPASAELELYDYLEDPLETRNLAHERPQVVARLRAMLETHPEALSPVRRGGAERGGKAKGKGKGKARGQAPPGPGPVADGGNDGKNGRNEKNEHRGGANAETRPPNVLVILADDLGWADVGFNGGTRFATPNLDRLAAEGVAFDDFRACPVCSPTRAGLLTGRWPHRYGLMRAVIPPWSAHGLPTSEPTLAERLAEGGLYPQRGIVGKWHLGHARPEFHPHRRGFTFSVGCLNGAIDYFTHRRDGERDWHRNGEPLVEEGYATDLIAEHALAFLEGCPEDEPWFLYVPFTAPHSPYQAKPEDMERHRDLRMRDRRAYAAMVESLDEAAGRILDALGARADAADTLALFFSDNGGIPRVGSDNGPWRGGKLGVYEGGTRVCAAMRWPAAGVAGGRRFAGRVGYIDLVPTVLAAAGVPDPGNLDGIDLLPALRGEAGLPERLWFSHLHQGDEAMASVHQGDWKLVARGDFFDEAPAEPPVYELYDLERDPAESEDLAAAETGRVGQLAAELRRFGAEAVEGVGLYREGREGFEPPKDWRIE